MHMPGEYASFFVGVNTFVVRDNRLLLENEKTYMGVEHGHCRVVIWSRESD